MNLTKNQKKFISKLKNPFTFKLYLLLKVPMGFFSGMKIVNLNRNVAVSSIKYKWINRNPFNSTYFASLSMAAELTTGVLALLASDRGNYSIAAIPVSMKADFIKAAKGRTVFTCDKGGEFFDAVEETVKTGKAVTVDGLTIGRDNMGVEICRFTFTWSFKKRD